MDEDRFSTGRLDLISTPSQGVVQTHGEAVCAGQTCVIHNPSEHHMREWELYMDPQLAYLAFRKCPTHGMEHPDPDSMAFTVKALVERQGWEKEEAQALGVHTCCGCCRPNRKKEST